MTDARPPVLVLTGPTGVGKTALSLELAERFDAEIVSADSRQVYRYLDIGTAKPTPQERARVPHHCLDLVNPDESFDAARHAAAARAAVADVHARGRRVIVCGGSGLYLRALTRGLFPGPGADPVLREALHAEAEAGGSSALHRRLCELDPRTAERLDPRDTVRVVRALEVALHTGRPLSSWHDAHRFGDRPYRTLTLALWMERRDLYRVIEDRCRLMVAQGLPAEVEGLFARGYHPDLPPLRSIGYREVGEHVRGILSLAQAIARMVRATRRYAKRQLTWFRHDSEVTWRPAWTPTGAIADEAERFFGADGRLAGLQSGGR